MGDMKKILITGAGGMLGADLVSALSSDFDVVGLDKKPAPHLACPLEICDLVQERKAHEAIVSQKPDLVFHCAALTDVDYCEEHHEEALAQNVEATQNVVRSCKELDIPVIFFSTDYVFDGSKKGKYTEEDETAPASFYGKTKRSCEEFILKESKKAWIFRISWLFGVYGRSFPKAILRQAAEVKKLSVVADQVGHPTYSKDVAAAMRDLLKSKTAVIFEPGNRLFHLVNSGVVSWADLARFILKESEFSNVRVENITSAQLKRPAPRPANSDLSTEKLKKELKIQLRSWKDAVKEFLEDWDAARKAREDAQQQKTVAEDNQPA